MSYLPRNQILHSDMCMRFLQNPHPSAFVREGTV